MEARDEKRLLRLQKQLAKYHLLDPASHELGSSAAWIEDAGRPSARYGLSGVRQLARVRRQIFDDRNAWGASAGPITWHAGNERRSYRQAIAMPAGDPPQPARPVSMRLFPMNGTPDAASVRRNKANAARVPRAHGTGGLLGRTRATTAGISHSDSRTVWLWRYETNFAPNVHGMAYERARGNLRVRRQMGGWSQREAASRVVADSRGTPRVLDLQGHAARRRYFGSSAPGTVG